MVRCAISAIKNPNNYFARQYAKLRARKNHQKAIVAIARKMLVIIYNMLKDGTKYEERNVAESPEKLRKEQNARVIARLKKQGYTITKADESA